MKTPEPHQGLLLPGEVTICKLSCPIPDGWMPIILYPFKLARLEMRPTDGTALRVENVGKRPSPFTIQFAPTKVMKAGAGAAMIAQELWDKWKGRSR